MFVIQVNTSRAQDGCFIRTFDALGNDAREFIKHSAATLRLGDLSLKCVATVLRNGTSLAQAKVLDC